MVGHNAISHVLLRLGRVFRHAVLPRDQSRVLRNAAHGVDSLEERKEHIGVVVTHLVLEDGGDSLEAHAGIHVLRGQRVQSARGIAGELHEHQVPDLQHVGVVLVDEISGVAASDSVVVDL